MEVLAAYFSEEKAVFSQKEKEEIEQVLDIGEYPHTKTDNQMELAALMQVIHAIYNYGRSYNQVLTFSQYERN